jgi:hypothetical protein
MATFGGKEDQPEGEQYIFLSIQRAGKVCLAQLPGCARATNLGLDKVVLYELNERLKKTNQPVGLINSEQLRRSP